MGPGLEFGVDIITISYDKKDVQISMLVMTYIFDVIFVAIYFSWYM